MNPTDNFTKTAVFTRNEAGQITGFTFNFGDNYNWPIWIEYTTELTNDLPKGTKVANTLKWKATNFPEERSITKLTRLETGSGEGSGDKTTTTTTTNHNDYYNNNYNHYNSGTNNQTTTTRNQQLPQLQLRNQQLPQLQPGTNSNHNYNPEPTTTTTTTPEPTTTTTTTPEPTTTTTTTPEPTTTTTTTRNQQPQPLQPGNQ